jgi:hypothetical protein
MPRNRTLDWEIPNIGQVLTNRPAKDTIPFSFQVLQDHISALLQEAHDNRQYPKQDIIDKI